MIKPSTLPALVACASAIGISGSALLGQASDSVTLLLRGLEGDLVAAVLGTAGLVMIAGVLAIGNAVVRVAFWERK
ncbi:hypothetical protein CRT60_00445 [Azospirillum palustre]|uniref:Uncharacterized protein n=1 Tax=Azospirillum palustre TaxID=2044885 RepID=A0A2B8BKX2_9PROT|nr:hypothetical protein [Azospirillum palustre]PGH59436.1 hypothetical protein CRT60_00445 [Azospirillum palustre]